MSMKIILTDSLKACPVEEIESTFTDIRFVEVSPRKLATITSKDNVIAVIGSRALVQKCANIDLTKCKFIQLFSTGYDDIDPYAFRKRGITMSNAKGIYDATLAEYVLFMMLKYAKRYHKSMKNNMFRPLRNYHYISEIEGKTIGIMGVGQIGSKIAKLLSGFDVKIIGFANRTNSKEYFDKIYHREELDYFLKSSDFIVNTLPHTTDTIGLLNKERFANFSETSVFINIGRDSIYEINDLIDFYQNHNSAVAIIDIFEILPNPLSRIHRLPNIYITPRIAAISKESDQKLKDLIYHNIEALLTNGTLKFVIN